MSLPIEIQEYILSFLSSNHNNLLLVNKDWLKINYNNIKKSINILSNWYNKNKIIHNDYEYDSTHQLIRNKCIVYEKRILIEHPEFIIHKLNLPENLLSKISSKNIRTAKEVREFLINLNLSLNDWSYVGF
jgi:hypothetical protein